LPVGAENMLGDMSNNKELPETLTACRLNNIGRDQINAFADMSGDYNPLHMDIDAAQRSGMNTIIAHGSIALNLLWESIERSFKARSDPEMRLDVRFRAPVHLDDSIETGGSRIENTDDYNVWVSNQDGERVIEGTLTTSTRTQ